MRVSGHGLAAEGKPFVVNERQEVVRAEGFFGRAMCSCGELGPLVGTDAERKRWHRTHKATVAAGITDGELGGLLRARCEDDSVMWRMAAAQHGIKGPIGGRLRATVIRQARDDVRALIAALEAS